MLSFSHRVTSVAWVGSWSRILLSGSRQCSNFPARAVSVDFRSSVSLTLNLDQRGRMGWEAGVTSMLVPFLPVPGASRAQWGAELLYQLCSNKAVWVSPPLPHWGRLRSYSPLEAMGQCEVVPTFAGKLSMGLSHKSVGSRDWVKPYRRPFYVVWEM